MSSAGRAANSNGCVSKPKEHATGLIGFAAQIRRSSLIGSCALETAEHRESRLSSSASNVPKCVVCGQIMDRWDSTKVPTFKLVHLGTKEARAFRDRAC